METKLSKNLKKTNVKNITLNQMNIINALKSGDDTALKIAETLTMSEHVVKSILGTLIKHGTVLKSEPKKSGDENTFELIQSKSNKKIKLAGDLNFPVSSFTDATGQRYVTRDTWHKIDDDIDLVNDIEWIDSKTLQNEKLKEIMKEASKKKSRTRRASTTKLAADAPASAEQRKLISKNTIDFININNDWKLRVLEISADSAVVVFSPRIFIRNNKIETTYTGADNEFEFTHGLLTKPETITTKELDLYMAGKKLPEYTKEKVEKATDTAYIINNDNNKIRFIVSRIIRGGKLETQEWVCDTEKNSYTRFPKTLERNTTTPEIQFEKYGTETVKYLIESK